MNVSKLQRKFTIKSCFHFQPLLHISDHALPGNLDLGKEVGGKNEDLRTKLKENPLGFFEKKLEVQMKI